MLLKNSILELVAFLMKQLLLLSLKTKGNLYHMFYTSKALYLTMFFFLSELDTFFELDIKEPFSVQPTSGELKANESVKLTFKFNPKVYLIHLKILK